MASVAQCRNVLKKEWFQRGEFVGGYLSEEDLCRRQLLRATNGAIGFGHPR